MTTAKISPLKKVSLTIGKGPNQAPFDSGEERVFSFIYGAASGGFCPFESHLADKHCGETLELSLSQEEVYEFFGHLFMPLKNCLDLHIMPPLLHLSVAVTTVEPAEDLEVITAMKDYLGSSVCGGGCGCGCQ